MIGRASAPLSKLRGQEKEAKGRKVHAEAAQGYALARRQRNEILNELHRKCANVKQQQQQRPALTKVGWPARQRVDVRRVLGREGQTEPAHLPATTMFEGGRCDSSASTTSALHCDEQQAERLAFTRSGGPAPGWVNGPGGVGANLGQPEVVGLEPVKNARSFTGSYVLRRGGG